MRFKKYKCVYIYTQYINETHICSRKIYILMMHQSRKEIGHRMSFTYIYAYDPNSEIFTPFIWRFFFGTLYILTNIYIYIQTYSTIAVIINIFIKQSIILGEGG